MRLLIGKFSLLALFVLFSSIGFSQVYPWSTPSDVESRIKKEEIRKVSKENKVKKRTQISYTGSVKNKDTVWKKEKDIFFETYNEDGYLEQEDNVKYEYNANGKIVRVFIGDKVIGDNSYTEKGKLYSRVFEVNDTCTWRTDYVYNKNGDVITEINYALCYLKYYYSKEKHGKLADSIEYSRYVYQYDKKGYLNYKKQQRYIGNGKDSLFLTTTYACDNKGNIILIKDHTRKCDLYAKYNSNGDLLEYTECADYGLSAKSLLTTLTFENGYIVKKSCELDNAKMYVENLKRDSLGKIVSSVNVWSKIKPVTKILEMYKGKYYYDKKGLLTKIISSEQSGILRRVDYKYEYFE